MKKGMLIMSLGIICGFMASSIYAHCEVPCGIYDDQTRITLIKEHIKTIEKSMVQITKLSSEKHNHINQIVRWINTKEEHANKIQHIVSQYFMTQRIKLTDAKDAAATAKYQKELALLHEILVYAMKAKQGTDTVYIEKLNKTIKAFEASYIKK